MKQVLVVVGPTASGKSALSVSLAKHFSTEIINGDSIQVYRGCNIGSGKITTEEMQGITHHLIDIKNPDEPYSSKDFQTDSRKWMESIAFPMISGGTGLYLKAALYDYSFLEEKESSNNYQGKSSRELYALLMEKDPKQAEKIHPNNVRRVIRALTILECSGEKMSDLIAGQSHEPIYDIYCLGCTMEREKLYQKINARVERMVKEGLKEEVEGLLAQGYTFQDPGLKGIGYKEWESFFKNECSEEEVIALIQKNSRHYAKRQYTWLNHQMQVHWYDMETEGIEKTMIKDIEVWKNKKTI